MNHRYIILGALLCAVISAPTSALALSPCPHLWQRDLRMGMNGEDVLQLQRYLNSTVDTTISPTGVGSHGLETRVYGPRTAAAVARFQEKYAAEILQPLNLLHATGSVGPRTRAKLNELCSASATTLSVVPPQTSMANALTISRPAQPAQTIAPSGAGGVPFTTFELTAGNADVHVTSITVQRAGAGMDGAFESIYIQSADGADASEEKPINSEHQAIFKTDFIIPAGTSKVFTVYGNMEDTTDYEGQMPTLRVLSLEATAAISGTLPLDGTAQPINASLEIGSATAARSSYDPAEDGTIYINETDVIFSGIRITANSKEDLVLESVTWEQAGSAGIGDVANIETFIDGLAYAAMVDGRTYESVMGGGLRIPRGRTVDIYVRGDVLPTAANRTVKFDLSESGALSLTGVQYGYGVGIAAASHTASSGNSVFLTSDGTVGGDELTPFFSGALFNVSGGALVSVSAN